MSEDEWRWDLSERAAGGLDALDSETQERILNKFDAVVTDEFRTPMDFTEPLTGAKPWRSLRVGHYRAIVRFDHEAKVMQVGAVGHRSSIYDEFP